MAAQAGVRVPEVVTAALGGGGNAFTLTRQEDTDPLELMPVAEVSDSVLLELWQGVGAAAVTGALPYLQRWR